MSKPSIVVLLDAVNDYEGNDTAIFAQSSLASSYGLVSATSEAKAANLLELQHALEELGIAEYFDWTMK